MPTLILTPRQTDDTVRLESAARAAGWEVLRLERWRAPAGLGAADVAIYGEPLLAEVVAAELGLALLEAPPGWLAGLPERWRRRDVHLTTLGAARGLGGPLFAKPALAKSFPARVYASGADIPLAEILPADEPALVSEPVAWEVEYRCLVAGRAALALSPYLRGGALAQAPDGSWPAPAGELAEAHGFVAALLADTAVALPPALVIDVGRIAGRGWAVVEANSVWGAGLYGCDAAAALAALRRSVAPRAGLPDELAIWARPPAVLEAEVEAALPAPDADGLVTLYRPVGARELALIAASGYRSFPPRLPEQPIFYPVLSAGYAEEIARGWNTSDPASSGVGHVTRFRVRAAALAPYPVQVVGAARHQELWVPAAELAALNAAIVGPIEVIASFWGERAPGA